MRTPRINQSWPPCSLLVSLNSKRISIDLEQEEREEEGRRPPESVLASQVNFSLPQVQEYNTPRVGLGEAGRMETTSVHRGLPRQSKTR